jgi:predicted aspartyl protease
MEIDTMGKVLVTAQIDNLNDLIGVQQGSRPADQVRSVVVTDALVDTGATTLAMPKRLIDQLGLVQFRTRQVRTAGGATTVAMYRAAQLIVQGRDCICDVMEVPDDCPVLIGQVPLELLDWVVDPIGQRLIGNPAHGGEQMLEAY